MTFENHSTLKSKMFHDGLAFLDKPVELRDNFVSMRKQTEIKIVSEARDVVPPE